MTIVDRPLRSVEQQQRPSRAHRRLHGRVGIGVVAILLLGGMALALLPFLFMAVTSLQEANRISLSFDPSKFSFQNYMALFAENGFGQALLTSVIVVTLACAVNAIVCSLAAYAFAKRPFPGSGALFWVYIATMMV